MLRIGVVTDSAAELPQSALAHPALSVLPVKIQIEGQVLLDRKDPEVTANFNAKHLNIKTATDVHSKAPSTEEVRDHYLQHLAIDFDHVFGMFVLGSRSPLFKNASDAASDVIAQSMAPRLAQGYKGPLFVEAYDSNNMSDGLSVLVQDALAQVDAEVSPAAMRSRINELVPKLHCYVVPSQLDFLATRAKARGDQSAGALAIAAAKLLGVVPIVLAKRGDTGPAAKVRGVEKARDHVLKLATREVMRGLKSKFVSLSYSGDPAEISVLSSYQGLVAACAAKGASLSLKAMSPTNSINVGPQALSLGFAAVDHDASL